MRVCVCVCVSIRKIAGTGREETRFSRAASDRSAAHACRRRRDFGSEFKVSELSARRATHPINGVVKPPEYNFHLSRRPGSRVYRVLLPARCDNCSLAAATTIGKGAVHKVSREISTTTASFVFGLATFERLPTHADRQIFKLVIRPNSFDLYPVGAWTRPTYFSVDLSSFADIAGIF